MRHSPPNAVAYERSTIVPTSIIHASIISRGETGVSPSLADREMCSMMSCTVVEVSQGWRKNSGRPVVGFSPCEIAGKCASSGCFSSVEVGCRVFARKRYWWLRNRVERVRLDSESGVPAIKSRSIQTRELYNAYRLLSP